MCHAHFSVIKIQLHFWQKYQVKKVFEDKFVFPKKNSYWGTLYTSKCYVFKRLKPVTVHNNIIIK